MKHVLTAAVLAALAAAPLWADDKKDAKKDDKPSVDQQFQDIVKEFQKAAEPLGKELQGAKTGEEREAIFAKVPKLAAPFVTRALKLAEDNLKDPAAVKALMFGLELGKSERAGALLFEAKGDSGEFVQILAALSQMAMNQGGDNPGVVKVLTLAAEKSKSKAVMGVALLGLAHVKLSQAESDMDEKKAAAACQQAEEHLTKVTKEYADESGPEGKLGSAAEQSLAQVRKLGLGKTAPEVVSKDLDDKETKLSALKGKVVVLDIWATWCGPCRAMIPHEREMVEKLKGKPFQLVSISADEKKEALTKFLESEKMPWTHWWEGGNKDGILKEWNVQFFPTIYVIDAKGVIRFKNIRGKKLEEAVEKLVKEAETKS
jgi:thiol-disulfide isomerase/thioredoxin